LSSSFLHTSLPPPLTHTPSLHDALPIYFESTNPPTPAANPPRSVIVLLDQSASMRRDGLWTDALARVNETVENLQPTDQFALFRSEEHTSELQSRENLVCRLLLEKKKHP